MTRQKKIKTAILVLAVLLALSLIALGLTLRRGSGGTTVTVPDNLITPDEPAPAAAHTSYGAVEARSASVLALYSKNPGDNAAFAVPNMLPGDSITQNYCVRVSHRGAVTVQFRADVRPGYEKLAEVLKTRVKLLTTGDTLYDGLMRDMPASLKHTLTSSTTVTDELYYQITAYLDTSVGNDYQDLELIADFRWWVETSGGGSSGGGELTPAPKTYDAATPRLWALLAAASGCALIILRLRRGRKEGEANG